MLFTDAQIERRLRRKLDKCGYKLHKMRQRDYFGKARYKVFRVGEDHTERETSMTLKQIIDFTELVDERRHAAAS